MNILLWIIRHHLRITEPLEFTSAIHENFKSTMKNNVLLFLAILLFSGCFTLDDNLFNNTKLTEYKLDAYTGDVDFHLDPSYQIADSMVHIFKLNSQAPGESSSTSIFAIYIGNINTISTDTVIMYCHGNKDHMDFYWPRAKLLAKAGGK